MTEPMHSTCPKPIASRLGAYAIIVVAGLVGGISLLVWAYFLFAGSLNLVDLGLSESARLAWNSFLCTVFFLQHSGMVRMSFRQWSARFIPSPYGFATYAVASGVVLLALIVLWQGSDGTILTLQGPLRRLLRAVYFLSLAGCVWGARALGTFDPFGLKPIADHLRGTESTQLPFTVRGPYRYVRHPLYAFVLLMIWSCPDLTADRLLFNALFSAWTIVGTILEERDLASAFGEDYRRYQRTVPMLIPFRVSWGLHGRRAWSQRSSRDPHQRP